jgi:hypothetical protein
MSARRSMHAVWLVAWCALAACGGGDGGDENTSVNEQRAAGGSASTPPADSATGSSTTSCVAASCPTLQLFGSAAPGCCQTTGECGGSVVYMGTPFCAPPDIEEIAAQIAAPFAQLEAEEIVAAEECAGMTIQSTMVPGCCDSTGVCGLSTAGFASSGSQGMLPFEIPATCISADEARAIGLVPPTGAAPSAPVACGGN